MNDKIINDWQAAGILFSTSLEEVMGILVHIIPPEYRKEVRIENFYYFEDPLNSERKEFVLTFNYRGNSLNINLRIWHLRNRQTHRLFQEKLGYTLKKIKQGEIKELLEVFGIGKTRKEILLS